VRLQQALVQRVRRDGRLLPLPPGASSAGAEPGVRRGVHPQRVVRVLERHPAGGAWRQGSCRAGVVVAEKGRRRRVKRGWRRAGVGEGRDGDRCQVAGGARTAAQGCLPFGGAVFVIPLCLHVTQFAEWATVVLCVFPRANQYVQTVSFRHHLLS
jgi:hypothetical protein